MILAVIVVLVFILIGLILYNLKLNKQLSNVNNTKDMINNLRVVQDFMDTIGKDTPAENKIRMINDIITEKFEIKYSTIVIFNGAEYIIKASNVDEKYWDNLKNLHTKEIFKNSIMTATPNYITANKESERLAYQEEENNKAKSAMFFPLYIDNVYIGYWIIESTQMNAFDKIDINVLGVVKENIVSAIKSIAYQNTIENIYRIDKTTNLFSAEYLYGVGKRAIDKSPQSTICMFKIINIDDINLKFGRKMGTETILRITNLVKAKIASEYIFVRYMGPKFAIAFTGADIDNSTKFLETMKNDIEEIIINVENAKKTKKMSFSPRINMIVSTYYKGTGIEEVTKKLEEYLDEADEEENDINCI